MARKMRGAIEISAFAIGVGFTPLARRANRGMSVSAGLSGYFNDTAKAGANAVLIVAWQSDGSVVVRTVVESDTAINTALASH